MKIGNLSIQGCHIITPEIHTDIRGNFVKTFIKDFFIDNGLESDLNEQFYTVSSRRTLRGMHIQTPPYQTSKLIYCMLGSIFDVILDLRNGSPTYGKHLCFEMNSVDRIGLYVAPGVAHGFYTMSDNAIMIYNTTCPYSPENDTGFLWNSAGIEWPDNDPVLSERDKNLVPLDMFESSFKFEKRLI